MSNHHEMHGDHSPEAIRRRLAEETKPSYVKDFIYGAIDGAVTTFAIVAASAGAGLGSGVIFVLGLANLLADGYSMAASNYLGTQADNQMYKRLRDEELEEIETHPEGEREEIRQIFKAQGFEGDTLEGVVDVVTSDKELWVTTMLREEHGIDDSGPRALPAAAATFVAFLVVGVIPILPYLLGVVVKVPEQFLIACVGTAVGFLGVGWIKGRLVGMSTLRSAVETLAVGGSAALVAYVVGALLKGFAA